MTIEEAIQHCHEVADKECTECGKEHLQLAEWLTELKQRRDAEITAPPKSNADLIRQMTDEELADWLNGICNRCISDDGYTRCPIYDGCAADVYRRKSWLKQEAKA